MQSDSLHHAIRYALAHYDDPTTLNTSSLLKLRAVRLARPTLPDSEWTLPTHGMSIRSMLESAIARLALHYPDSAELLKRRYQQDIPNSEIHRQLGLRHAAFHRQLNTAIERLEVVVLEMEAEATALESEHHRSLLAFVPLVTHKIVGIASLAHKLQTHLEHRLHQSRSPIVVTGLGGLGKTTLIAHTLRPWVTAHSTLLERVLWINVPRSATYATERSEHIIETILAQVGLQLDLPLLALATVEERFVRLITALSGLPKRVVIIIDNVESEVALEGVLQFAKRVAHLMIVVIASRRDPPPTEPRFAVIPVHELALEDALDLVSSEAPEAVGAESQRKLVKVIGGHPLALLLAIAQCRRLPLEVILNSLVEPSRWSDDLYDRIYALSWQLLSEVGQSILIGLSALPQEGGYWEQIELFARVATPTVTRRAIEVGIGDLMMLNLLQISGAARPVYALHRLTYHFVARQTGMTSYA